MLGGLGNRHMASERSMHDHFSSTVHAIALRQAGGEIHVHHHDSTGMMHVYMVEMCPKGPRRKTAGVLTPVLEVP